MSTASPGAPAAPPSFPQRLGHPAPLWMLFMTEYWERFAFYGMRWALTLYIVAQFYGGSGTGEAPANDVYGAYLALIYAASLFGGYVADQLIGYQRSILIGAVIMASGLFVIMIPNQEIFLFGLALVIVGNGLFKPNISTMVGQLYSQEDRRRDAGFTIFYMGINLGGFLSPLVTGWLASVITDTPLQQNYKVVFLASGVGMILSFLWFWFGRRQLHGIGRPPAEVPQARGIGIVLGCAAIGVPLVYFLLSKLGATALIVILGVLFIGLAVMLLVEGIREGAVARDKVVAMLIIFVFNALFWMFFEQAGSSFNFLAQNIVDRMFGSWEFPVAWFQSVNSLAIIGLAPIIAAIWIWMGKRNVEPSIPRKFGLGLVGNGLAFLLLMYALTYLVDAHSKIPFWTLFMVYVIQSVGELCLSPVGLSMVTKLAPPRYVGFAMGGWFLSIANGNNMSGVFAAWVSGETGMTTGSALSGYTLGFWALAGAGVVLFLIAPLIQKLMHGVR
ncbi:POT family proton-dependent oligopeptide transporter [Dokdonella fugitiva]|uniref:POT family proton-dependent oligopeptide transporter n=1 Tax=Dokdonella fugitiva TaxID=328517 RepID=A0A839F1Q5_9GAMM|nr:peptide MFS transporter [Dokdonella fugitiva]MBA8888526.1 POT family proton-dependent oligopeptide transporter [Dokdonella fugitiva]